MSRKNEIFGEALDWLVTNKGIKGQKGLAWSTGITVNTISRIMTGKVEPSDDTLRKISQKYGFNMQWLRGEEGAQMFSEDKNLPQNIDQSSLVNAALAAKDETIQALHDQIDTKNELIDSLRQHLSDLRDKMHYGHSEYGRKGMMASEDLGDV